MAHSTRWLVGTLAVVVLVAVAAVVVAAVREPADLPPGTPESVVQAYLRAVAEGDLEAAQAMYTPGLGERCEPDDGPGPRPFPEDRPSFQASLLDTRQRGERVEVRVRITEFAGEPPFGGGYDHTEVFVLEPVDGGWGIAQVSWPYFLCPG